jgi:hypothetical protein
MATAPFLTVISFSFGGVYDAGPTSIAPRLVCSQAALPADSSGRPASADSLYSCDSLIA